MEYLKHFNLIYDGLVGSGVTLNDKAVERLRKDVQETYKQGFKHGTNRLKEEELDVDKAIKLQRVMNGYGAKK